MLNLATIEHGKIFAKNLAVLKKSQPLLYQKIVECVDSDSFSIIRLSPSDILPNLLLRLNGKKILYYDQHAPFDHCKSYVESLNLKFAPIAVFLGFGLGYQVFSVLRDFSEKLNIQHILIVEKDLALFRTALQILDLTQIIDHPRIRFIVGVDAEDLHLAYQTTLIGDKDAFACLDSIKFIPMPAAHLMDGAYYRKAVDILKLSIKHSLLTLGNEPYDAIIGIEHVLKNIVEIIENPGISAFRNAFKGRPAVVIGAGPSLKKNMHLLKEAYPRALLVSVDAALKPLMSEGIKPHLVTTIERTEVTVDFYKNLKGLDDVYFVFCSLIEPATYKAYKGPKIVSHRYPEHDEWFRHSKGSLGGGPLVGNFAFDIAQYLGCNPIILVGKDLSFKPTGLTHVFGDVRSYRKELIEVESNYGDTLVTNIFFEHSLQTLEMQIAAFDGLCVNATEGGAKVKGSLFLDLRNTLKLHCRETFECAATLKQIWESEMARIADSNDEIRKVSHLLGSMLDDLELILEKCRYGLQRIESVLDQAPLIDGEPNADILKAIPPIEKELNQLRNDILSLPSMLMLSHVFQCFHAYFEIERNFLYDQFYNRNLARLKDFMALKKWFSIIGQLTLSTRYRIEGALPEIENLLRRETH